MKSLNRFCIIAAITVPLLTACMDNDVYDPSKTKPAEPTENPFENNINVPDGFDWSMANSVNLNVEVKDEFQGQYQYLIEVFNNNPLSAESATPFMAGYANQNANFIAEITIPKTMTRLFIRQTDPKQRKEIYEYAVPANGGDMNCKLYHTGATTRAANSTTSAFDAALKAGVKELEDKEYKEAEVIPSVPATSDDYVQWNPGALGDNARFIIGTQYTESDPFTTSLRTYNSEGRATVFVQGIWKLGGWAGLNSNLDIYVMNGGKIIAENFTIGNGNTLTIQSGGAVTCTTLSIGCSVKNFGSITATGNISMNQDNNPELFNNGTIKSGEDITLNNVKVINHHTLAANKFSFIGCEILNKAYIDCATDIYMNGGGMYNYGDIAFNLTNGKLITNNSIATVIINHHEADIKGYDLDGGLSLYNDGVVEVSTCTNSSSDILYNSCTLIIKEKFVFRNVTLDKGSITGGRESANATEWLPVPQVISGTDAKFTLMNNSMIKAGTFTVNNGRVEFTGVPSTDTEHPYSMIKVQNDITFAEPTHVFLKGSLVIEGNIIKQGQNADFAVNESVSTGFDESKYTIETCGGIFNEGNEGLSPSDPAIPAEIEDGATYTYAFEDQWPVYGDFDMNDLVISIDKKLLTTQNKKLTIQGRICAVGAGRNIGAGIRFLNVSASSVTSVEGKTQSTNGSKATLSFESSQEYPVIILCEDAHKFCGNPDSDKTFFCTDPNVDSQYNTGDGANFEITMQFNSEAEAQKAYAINNIDVFIINKAASGGIARTEVHVAGYAPTDVANMNQFGTANDASKANSNLNSPAKGNYISVDGLAWGICIPLIKGSNDKPNVWAWPRETSIITGAYPEFKTWITSNGADAKDWATRPSGNIFVKPSK